MKIKINGILSEIEEFRYSCHCGCASCAHGCDDECPAESRALVLILATGEEISIGYDTDLEAIVRQRQD